MTFAHLFNAPSNSGIYYRAASAGTGASRDSVAPGFAVCSFLIEVCGSCASSELGEVPSRIVTAHVLEDSVHHQSALTGGGSGLGERSSSLAEPACLSGTCQSGCLVFDFQTYGLMLVDFVNLLGLTAQPKAY